MTDISKERLEELIANYEAINRDVRGLAYYHEVESALRELQRLRFKADYVDRRLCADHSGKWMPGRCLLCEIERLREQVRVPREPTEA